MVAASLNLAFLSYTQIETPTRETKMSNRGIFAWLFGAPVVVLLVFALAASQFGGMTPPPLAEVQVQGRKTLFVCCVYRLCFLVARKQFSDHCINDADSFVSVRKRDYDSQDAMDEGFVFLFVLYFALCKLERMSREWKNQR